MGTGSIKPNLLGGLVSDSLWSLLTLPAQTPPHTSHASHPHIPLCVSELGSSCLGLLILSCLSYFYLHLFHYQGGKYQKVS